MQIFCFINLYGYNNHDDIIKTIAVINLIHVLILIACISE